jgi:hypothetical protein
MAELIANAWDADARRVDIEYNLDGMFIKDNGIGMDVVDANDRFLAIGYNRREADNSDISVRYGRKVLGRKGIGKLSFFDLADTIEVHSRKNEGVPVGMLIEYKVIKDGLAIDPLFEYHPREIDCCIPENEEGTYIQLRNINKSRILNDENMRGRIASRFSLLEYKILNEEDEKEVTDSFEVYYNSKRVDNSYKKYLKKLEYIFPIDYDINNLGLDANVINRTIAMDEELKLDNLSGWIGLASESSDLIDDFENNDNKVKLVINGKVADDNILNKLSETGIFAVYVVGEINVDFLDSNEHDPATTNRQNINQRHPQYDAVIAYLKEFVRKVGYERYKDKNKKGKSALLKENPKVKAWYSLLNPDQKVSADTILGKVNTLLLKKEEKKRVLYSTVVAFQSISYRNNIRKLEDFEADDFVTLSKIFDSLEDIEMAAYYNVVKDRLETINVMHRLEEDNKKEKYLQRFLFSKFWLFEPSWSDISALPVTMEKTFKKAFIDEGVPLLDENLRDDYYNDQIENNDLSKRFDIAFRTSEMTIKLIELKRSIVTIKAQDLINQLIGYWNIMERLLKSYNSGRDEKDHRGFEIIAVTGGQLYDEYISKSHIKKQLEGFNNIKVMTYSSMLESAEHKYNDYIDMSQKNSEYMNIISGMIDEITKENED